MDGSSEPDIIRIRRPVIDERDGAYYLYFHRLESHLPQQKPYHDEEDFNPDDW